MELRGRGAYTHEALLPNAWCELKNTNLEGP